MIQESFEERYILEWAEMSGMTWYTLYTDYFIDNEWREVHKETFLSKPEFLETDCEIVQSDYVSFLKKVTYKPKSRTREGIWFKNNERKTNPLAHFTNVITDTDLQEPVWENLAEAHFYQKDTSVYLTDSSLPLKEYPELTECLNRVEEDVMYFNFNWIPEQNNPTPLKLILELMDKKMEVDIVFHDKEGKVIYRVKLLGFKFQKIYNLRNYNWSDNNIKELAVEYTFQEEQIIV